MAPIFRLKNTHTVVRIPEILRICSVKKILHLGCAGVPFALQKGENLLHKKLAKVTKPHMLWGIDISEQAICLLRKRRKFTRTTIFTSPAVP